MPPFDLALVLVALLGAANLLPRPLYRLLVFVTLTAQLILIGPHWQIAPAYLALALTLLPTRRTKLLAASAILLCCASLALLWALPLFKLPPPTGPYAVGTTGPLTWTDTTRSLNGDPATSGRRRELPVQIWYPAPASATGERARYARFRELSLGHSYESVIRTNAILRAPIAAGPFPVLIFGHRWAGSRTQDTFLIEDLASHGYVVIAADHPLNAARAILADGSVLKSDRADALANLEASSAPAIEALWLHELNLWVADDEFLLTTLFADPAFNGKLDPTRIGAFGHSFGGAAATALLGRDPRVKSAVNLDGWTFQALDTRTHEPILLLYEGSGEIRLPPHGVEGALDTADFTAIDTSLRRFGGLRAFVAGTQHLDFTDQTLTSPLRRLTFTGPIPGPRIRAITRSLVLGFFNQTLRGEGSIPAYPEVKMERFPPS
jgi:predicted dienelactone hydrolase